jgi:hypothetical protein
MNTLTIPSTNAPFFDTVVLWKILVLLGYLELTEDLQELFTIDLSEIVDLPDSVAKRLIKDVTDAIHRTQL